MSSWRHTLLALAALALGALWAGCESFSSEAKVDPSVVPWSQKHDPEPLTDGGQWRSHASEHATYKDQPVADDPNAIPWDHDRVSDPPTVGNPLYEWPPGSGLKYLDSGLKYLDGPGNGLR